jgi:hypothetical protein
MKPRSLIVLALSCLFVAFVVSNASALQMYTPDYNDDQIIGIDYQGVAPAPSLPGSAWDISVAGTDGLWSLGINRDGVRGVAAYGSVPKIEPFTIAADGSISSPQPTLTGTGGYSTATSPISDFVYFTANVAPYGITAAKQAADGSLTYLPGPAYLSGTGVGDIAITPNGKYLFAAGPANTISRFSIAADGTLTAIGVATITGVDLLQISPDGRFLYAQGTNGTDRIHSLAVGADGALTEIPPAYDMGDTQSGKFAVNPSGTRLYVPNSNSNQIVTLASSPSGVLSLVGSRAVGDDFKAVAVSATNELFLVRTSTESGLYYAQPDALTGVPGAPVKLVSENWNYGTRTVFRPGFGGTAGALKITPNAEPLSFTLDAAGSTGFARLEWSIGNPAAVTNTTTTKTKFTAPGAGKIPISVKAFDANGCASDLFYTGQSTICTGNPNAIKSATLDTPAWVTSLKVSPSKVTKKTKIKFKLTESASVSFYAQKPVKGRTVGTSCKKQTKKNKSAKRCTLWARASKTFRKSGKAGKTNSVTFTGKVGKAQLSPGSYRLFAVATDSAKNKGPSKTASFKIKKPKKK